MGPQPCKGRPGYLLYFNFSHSLVSHVHYGEGRESIVTISQGGREIALCNVYGPNGDNTLFFQELGVKIQNLSAATVILGGDLNTVLSPREDRRSGRDPQSTLSGRTSDKVLHPPPPSSL